MNTWNRIEELMDFVKTHDIKELKDYWNHKEDEKRCNTILWVLAIIGAVAAVAAIAYAVYRYLTPDYLDDFDDDFDDEEYDEKEYEEEWEKGDTFTAGNVRYKVTKRKGKKGEVAVAGVKSKKVKSIVIPKKVKKGSITFAVTSIQNNAFRGCKKAKVLTIRSTGIRTIAKKALNGMNKRIRIQLPKGKAKKYQKLLIKCGYRVIRS